MWEKLQHPSFQQGFAWLLVGMILLGGLYFLMRRLRGSEEQAQVTPSDMLTKFREMHAQGVLSDEEYRTIKTNLTAELQREINDSKGTG